MGNAQSDLNTMADALMPIAEIGSAFGVGGSYASDTYQQMKDPATGTVAKTQQQIEQERQLLILCCVSCCCCCCFLSIAGVALYFMLT